MIPGGKEENNVLALIPNGLPLPDPPRSDNLNPVQRKQKSRKRANIKKEILKLEARVLMKIPLQITVRNLSLSEAAERDIRAKAEDLNSINGQIISCRVVVDAPHRHHHKGVLYNLRIDLKVPGKEFIVTREHHEDVYVAIRDGFDAVRRRLEDFGRRQRGEVKLHEEISPYGVVLRIFSQEGYGFIETDDGREIYFHRNSVLKEDFGHLKIGSIVRFVEEIGEKGPQASTVQLL